MGEGIHRYMSKMARSESVPSFLRNRLTAQPREYRGFMSGSKPSERVRWAMEACSGIIGSAYLTDSGGGRHDIVITEKDIKHMVNDITHDHIGVLPLERLPELRKAFSGVEVMSEGNESVKDAERRDGVTYSYYKARLGKHEFYLNVRNVPVTTGRSRRRVESHLYAITEKIK